MSYLAVCSLSLENPVYYFFLFVIFFKWMVSEKLCVTQHFGAPCWAQGEWASLCGVHVGTSFGVKLPPFSLKTSDLKMF